MEVCESNSESVELLGKRIKGLMLMLKTTPGEPEKSTFLAILFAAKKRPEVFHQPELVQVIS